MDLVSKVRPGLCEGNKLHGSLGDADQTIDAAQLVAVALALGDAARVLQALEGLTVVLLRGGQTRQLKGEQHVKLFME